MDTDRHPNTASDEPGDAAANEALQSARPTSPCIRVCTLDDSKHCVGCRRSVEEIVAWPRMSAGEQTKLLQVLADRW